MSSPTEKQLDFISDIEEFSDENFKGTSKIEATAYIKKNIETYKLRSMNSHSISNGYF